MPGRIRSLDGLRTFAVLVVMAMHANLPFAKGGGIGVDLFFVLSGFLITSLLIKEWDTTGTISLRGFYRRRLLRLLPAACFMLSVYLVYSTFWESGADRTNTYEFTGYALLYFANWARALHLADHPALGHTWSLSIEEQFYFVWPLLLIWMLRSRIDRRVILVLIVIAIACVTTIRAMLWHGPASLAFTYNSLPTRADALLAGCAVAFLASLGWLPVRSSSVNAIRLTAALGGLLFCYVVFNGASPEAYARGLATLLALTVAVGIIALTSNPPKLIEDVLAFPPIVWVGAKLSYGLYLWHFPLYYVIGWPSGWSAYTVLSVRFGSSFALALLSYWLIERRFLAVKDKPKERVRAHTLDLLPSFVDD